MLATQSDYLVNIEPGQAANAEPVLSQQNTVAKVAWKSHSVQTTTTWTTDCWLPETETRITLGGILKLAVPATELYTSFEVNGHVFRLVNPRGAGTTAYNFTYTGKESAAAIHSLLVPGTGITFHA